MRRAASFVGLVACAFAGIFAAVLLTVPIAGADDGTTGTTTEPPPTTTDSTTTAPPPGPKLIAAGVTIGGTLVGGLTPAEARELVRGKFARQVTLVVSPTRRIRVTPQEVGAAAHLGKAVKLAARVKRAGFVVPLKVDVPSGKLERYLRGLGRELDRAPVDSRLVLRKLKPFATPEMPGRRLKQIVAARQVRLLLKTHVREPLQLPFDELRAKVSERSFKQVIVLRRESRRLFFYNGLKLKRTFRVATGQSSYPTPLGAFEIVVKQRDPWWYPPEGSAWAAGARPIPPGPGNPLGTRWMGISAPYVGIHGTPDAASIGYSASHGCVRMLIPEVEWLFERVEVGTPVFIVPA